MATAVIIEGWEHGVNPTTSGGGLADVVTGTPTVVTSPVRTGTYALQINPSAATEEHGRAITAADIIVVRGYIQFQTSLPGADCILVRVLPAAGQVITLRYDQSSNVFKVLFQTGTEQLHGTTLAADTWYRIDMRIDYAANPHTCDWAIDGTAGTQATLIEAGSQANRIRWGNSLAATFTAIYDDWVISATTGDYPIGAGQVEGLAPNADGTHNAGTNEIERTSDGADIGVVTAFDLLNELPMTGTTNSVRQTGGGASNNNYAEVAFANTSNTTINGVMAYLSYNSAATQANNGETQILSGTTTTVVFDGDMSQTALFYKSVIVSPDGGAWTQTLVNALLGRVGFSTDGTPDPQWQDLIIQVDSGGVSTQTVSPNSVASDEAVSTLGGMQFFYAVGSAASDEGVSNPSVSAIVSPPSAGADEGVGGLTQVTQILFPNNANSDEAVSTINLLTFVLPASAGADEGVPSPSIVAIVAPNSAGADEGVGGLTQVAQTLFPDSGNSDEAVSTVNLLTFVLPNSAGADEAVSNPSIVAIVAPSSAGADEGFGGLTQIALIIFPGSGASDEGVPSITVSVGGAEIISPDSISPDEGFGGLTQIVQVLFPGSGASDEGVPSPNLQFAYAIDSIGSDEAVSTPTLLFAYAIGSAGSDEGVSSPSIVAIVVPSSAGADEGFGGLTQIAQTVPVGSVSPDESVSTPTLLFAYAIGSAGSDEGVSSPSIVTIILPGSAAADEAVSTVSNVKYIIFPNSAGSDEAVSEVTQSGADFVTVTILLPDDLTSGIQMGIILKAIPYVFRGPR